MHQINIKISRRLSELFKSSKLSRIHSNSSSTLTGQIRNEINDLKSKYFESSERITSTSTNRVFNLNSTNATLKAFKSFDDSIEKIDFVPKKMDFAEKKSTQFLSNISSKTAKETTRKRKANQLSI